MLRVYGCITEQHDLRLVFVAGMICLFACFTAFSLAERAQTAKGLVRHGWLAAAALVTGSGVWATHFVAMLAFQPGLPVGYDLGLTALSVLLAIIISGLGFSISLNRNNPLLGGATVGLAVAAMHFVGTAALELPARMNWDPAYVAASLLIGVGLGATALTAAARLPGLRGRSISAGLLTLGICGMHFTAMAALSFSPDPLIRISEQALQSERMAIAVIGVAVLIVVAGLIGFFIDQRRAQRAVLEAERLRRHLTSLEEKTEALRRSEERLRGIAENLPGFLFQCFYDAEKGVCFKIVGSNKFDFAGGAERHSSYGGERTLDFVMEEDRSNLETTVIAAHRGQSGWEYTFRVAASDGSWPWVQAIARLTPDAQRSGVWDGIALDQTDRIATSAQNAKLQAKLRQAEKMEAIGTLAGGVAHELNNLLQPIIMMTELVLTELPRDGENVAQLNRVVDAGAKAAEIVQRILAFGRADEVSHNLLDIGVVAREAISFVRTILPSSITLKVEIDDTVGAVRGDKTQLTQVLINLATNARDAIGANVGTVWMSLSKTDIKGGGPVSAVGTLAAGPHAVLTVRDSGAGMDKATVNRIFEPFYTTKGVGKGTGLGLSVTHGIITGHGGAIHVESTPGVGTSFSVLLPIAEADVPVALAG
jgi:NO-binding membrane sensor protein with MHYT domain/signal transduction histidine kinase